MCPLCFMEKETTKHTLLCDENPQVMKEIHQKLMEIATQFTIQHQTPPIKKLPLFFLTPPSIEQQLQSEMAPWIRRDVNKKHNKSRMYKQPATNGRKPNQEIQSYPHATPCDAHSWSKFRHLLNWLSTLKSSIGSETANNKASKQASKQSFAFFFSKGDLLPNKGFVALVWQFKLKCLLRNSL